MILPTNTYRLKGRWIMRDTGDGWEQIVGRIFGGDGYMHYQIAGRPYDEIPVGPFKDEQAAFDAAVAALKQKEQ